MLFVSETVNLHFVTPTGTTADLPYTFGTKLYIVPYTPQASKWGTWYHTLFPVTPPMSGECCEPQWGSGQSPDRPKVFHYFQHSGWPLLTL